MARRGIAALSMLNIMELFPMAQYGHNSVGLTLHVMIEAKKLALRRHVPNTLAIRASRNPGEGAHLERARCPIRAKLIDMSKAASQVVPSEVSAELNKHGKNSNDPTSPRSTKTETLFLSFRATTQAMAPGWSLQASDSPSTTEGPDSSSLLACPIR